MEINEVISRIENHMVVHKMREFPNAVHITEALEIAINFLKEHRWHDLRENPNDLPSMIKDERMISDSVWIHIENWGTEVGYYDYRKNAWIVRCRIVNLNVLAWIDIPKFFKY